MAKKGSAPEKKPKKSDKPAKEPKKTKKAAAEIDVVLPSLPVLVAKDPAPVAEPPEPAAPKKKKAPAPKKPAAKKEADKPAKAEKPKKKQVEPVIAQDDIALRAYFIAERRQKLGWPGDSTSDWVEAERQLIAEAKRAARD